MKFFNLLILAIVLVLVVSISSKRARKSKSHKKAPITLEKFIATSDRIDPDKVQSFREMSAIAGETCKKECTIHRATYFLIRGDAYVCKCFSSWYRSKHGDTWTKLEDDDKKVYSEKIEEDGVAIIIN